MNSKTSGLVSFLVFLFLFVIVFEPACSAVSVDEVGAALDKAERDLSSAFVAVADAGDAGAEVAGLLERLSVAGGYLSEARAAQRVGDYETAYTKSVACSNSLDGIATEAVQLRASAESSREEALLFTVVGSSVGLALLVVLGLFVWRLVSRWYLRQVLELKPVVEDRR